jgi:putative flippase GtrA
MIGASIRQRLARGDVAARVGAFALVSGVGLMLDVGIFLALTELGWRAGFANLLSAFCAVTFVYFVSTRRIFSYQGRFLFALFAVYLAYQAAAVALASWAVDSLVLAGLVPIVAKGVILPATFTANYLFMHWLTRSGAKP